MEETKSAIKDLTNEELNGRIQSQKADFGSESTKDFVVKRSLRLSSLPIHQLIRQLNSFIYFHSYKFNTCQMDTTEPFNSGRTQVVHSPIG